MCWLEKWAKCCEAKENCEPILDEYVGYWVIVQKTGTII